MHLDVLEQPSSTEHDATSQPRVSAAEPRAAPLLDWREAVVADARALAGRDGRAIALSIVTLGLYQCWVRTRLRRHIWSAVHVGGRPLRYTGTVRDMLVPVLAAMAGLAVIAIGAWIAHKLAVPKPKITPNPWRLLVTVPLVYMLGLAAWRHRAEMMARTQLDGAIGALSGNRHGYAIRHLASMLAMPLTLGWVLPWRQVLLQRRMLEGIRLGRHRLKLDLEPRALLARFAVAWLGAIAVYLGVVFALALTMGKKIVRATETGSWPLFGTREWLIIAALGILAGAIFGLIAAWYRIGVWRSMAAATRLDGQRLQLDVATADYLALVTRNMALRIASGFILSPEADLRHTRFVLSRLKVQPVPAS